MFKLASSLTLVLLCASCGDRFVSSEAAGGSTGRAGAEASAGQGSSGDAGAGVGGSSGAGGAEPGGGAGSSTGGEPSGGAGAGSGGNTMSGGSAGATMADCTTLKLDYRAALDKAKQCDNGTSGQCSPSSTLPALGCACPVLVNAKSEATATARRRYQALQSANCDSGTVCGIPCAPYLGASCSSQPMGSGSVCTASGAIN